MIGRFRDIPVRDGRSCIFCGNIENGVFPRGKPANLWRKNIRHAVFQSRNHGSNSETDEVSPSVPDMTLNSIAHVRRCVPVMQWALRSSLARGLVQGRETYIYCTHPEHAC